MTLLKLAILCSASTLAAAMAAPLAAQSVPTGDPGTPLQGADLSQPDVPASAEPTQTGDDIVVTGVRASLEKGLAVKRSAIQVVESVIAEDVGKLPDNNVISALQRVSGVQVTDRSGGEANTISIRGLPDALTTLNGRVIFTADARQFALADIPSTLVSRIDVYKTRAADQIETGLAGQVDVFTHRPFDFKGLAISGFARGIYNEQADKISPYLSALVSNRWETGIGEVGISVNGTWSRNRYRDQSITAGALVPFASTSDLPIGSGAANTCNPPNPNGWGPLERIQPTDCRAPGQTLWRPGDELGLPSKAGSTLLINGVQSPYLLSRDAVFQSDLQGDRKRPAVNAAVQWAPNPSSTYTFEFFWDGFRNTTFNNLLFSFVDYPGAVGPDPAASITTYEGTNIIKTRHVGFPFTFASGDATVSKTDSFVYALNGKWDVGDNLQLSADASYQTSKFNTRFLALRTTRVAGSIDVDFNAKDGLPAYAYDDNSLILDPAQWNVGEFYDNENRNTGNAYTFQGDGDWTPASDFFKKLSFGVRYDDRRADNYLRSQDAPALNVPFSSLGDDYFYTNKDFAQGRVDVPSKWVVGNGYYIANHADDLRQRYQSSVDPGILLSDQLTLAHTLDVREITKSAYVQGDVEVDVLGRPLQVEAGVRFTDVKTPLTFTDRYTGVSTSAKQHVHKFLPALTVRYDVTDEFRLRFNYGKTLRRPDFGALDPNFALTGDLTQVGYGSGSGGNPDLQPTRSTNYDFTAEWYFSRGSAIYGTAFRREINGLVITIPNVRTITGTGLNTDTFIVNQPTNASNGVLKGIELGTVLFPELPGIFKGFGAQGSFTLLRSSQNIPVADPQGNIIDQQKSSFFGVSKFSYNITAAYDRGPVGLRLSYVWRKPFLNANEARLFANPIGIWRRAEKSLDFQATLQATKDFAVTFDAVNLTKEYSQQYYYFGGNGGPNTDNQVNAILARTFALGVRYSFK